MFFSKIIRKLQINKRELFLVIILALFVTFLSSAKYFSQLLQIPKGHVFIGMSHYYEDFYYYLDQFYQGAHGGWLTYNNFTTEPLKPTPVYFNNIILGKIGGLFGLESFASYNLSLIILKFIYLIACYLLLIKVFPNNKKLRFASFVLFLFATSFPVIQLTKNGLVDLGPVTIFRAKNTFFSRFENVPGNYIQRIIFITLLLVSIKYNELIKKQKIQSKNLILFIIILTILTMLLTLSDPINGLIFVLIFLIFSFSFNIRNYLNKSFHYFLPLIISIGLGFLITAAITYRFINSDPVYLQANVWDYNEYVKQFSLLDLFRHIQAFGALGLLFIVGTIYLLRRKRSIGEDLLLSTSYISIFGFLLPYLLKIPIPGFRFFTVSTYLFMAVIAVYGILFIETILNKKIFLIVIILYLSISSLTIYPVLLKEVAKPIEPSFHFTYMPKELYDGLIILRNLSPKNAIVLGNPLATTDLYIPGLTGKKTFTGHSLTNLNAKEKDKIVAKFYYEWTDKATALEFLKLNSIKYIMHTRYSNNFEPNQLKIRYPFLKEVFRNNIMAIFTY